MNHPMWTALAAALFLVTTGCGKDSTANSATISLAQKPQQQQSSDPMEIKAEPALLQRLQIGEPVAGEVGTTITVAARIEEDDTRITRVGSPVMGRIASISVREGQEVKKGQVLAQLNSIGMSGAQLEFLKAITKKQLARRSVDRAQQLLKADVIGAAEVQRREAELNEATAELDAAHSQLLLLGMPESEIRELERTRVLHPVSPVVATMEGTVMSRKVTVGQVVQPADTVVEIADLSSVWLVADVPEQNAGALHEGLHVHAEIAALPGHRLEGSLMFVSSTVNSETRTVRARMDIRNPRRLYKPSMLATMEIHNQKTRQTLVPSTAVVREGNQECVFAQLAPDVFVLRPVKIGADHGSQKVLLEGIRPGEKVFVYRAGAQPREGLLRRRRMGLSIWLTSSMEKASGS
jgi:cobalt-zinc-cadmium efflux system membrane fusion protein